MALVTRSIPVLGKRRHIEGSCVERTTFKRGKQATKSEPDSAESDLSGVESDFELSSDGESLSSASTPPTPQSGATSQNGKLLNRPLRYKCTYDGCDKAFSRPVRLEEHIRSHRSERIFKCTYEPCDKAFLRQSHLSQHIKSAHTGVRDYICDWEGCDMKFATGTRLRRHREAHEKRDRFRCTAYPPCNETFRKHATLQRHINSEHLQLKPYLCKRSDESTGGCCPAAFDTAGGLRSHEAKCHEGKQYWCSICKLGGSDDSTSGLESASFVTYAELQTHMKIQHPPECEHCGLICLTAGELQRHTDLYHSGISLDDRRTFMCPEPDCGKGFTKHGNLKIHIRSTHEKKKPFVCGETNISHSPGLQNWDGSNACKRAFTAKRSLETHVRKFHLDESRPQKPAKRTRMTDQQSYKQTPSLAAKLTGSGYVEESGRQLACPIHACEYRFKRHADLRQHARVAHGLHEAEAAEAFAESEALSGGRFWLGGANDEVLNNDNHDYNDDLFNEDDWREATGLDTLAVNIRGGHGFGLPSADAGSGQRARSLEFDETHLADVLASCVHDDMIDPTLIKAE